MVSGRVSKRGGWMFGREDNDKQARNSGVEERRHEAIQILNIVLRRYMKTARFIFV